MINQSTKFEVSKFTHYEDMKGRGGTSYGAGRARAPLPDFDAMGKIRPLPPLSTVRAPQFSISRSTPDERQHKCILGWFFMDREWGPSISKQILSVIMFTYMQFLTQSQHIIMEFSSLMSNYTQQKFYLAGVLGDRPLTWGMSPFLPPLAWVAPGF